MNINKKFTFHSPMFIIKTWMRSVLGLFMINHGRIMWLFRKKKGTNNNAYLVAKYFLVISIVERNSIFLLCFDESYFGFWSVYSGDDQLLFTSRISINNLIMHESAKSSKFWLHLFISILLFQLTNAIIEVWIYFPTWEHCW